MTFNFWKFKAGKSKRCSVCAIALLFFHGRMLITARFAHIDHVRPIAVASSSFAFITLTGKCRHWNRGFKTSIQSC